MSASPASFWLEKPEGHEWTQSSIEMRSVYAEQGTPVFESDTEELLSQKQTQRQGLECKCLFSEHRRGGRR